MDGFNFGQTFFSEIHRNIFLTMLHVHDNFRVITLKLLVIWRKWNSKCSFYYSTFLLYFYKQAEVPYETI